jgi:hypothetical protein
VVTPTARPPLERTIAPILPLRQSKLLAEIEHIRERRDAAPTLAEMAEWCVAYEEAIGGRPPTSTA